MKVAVLDLGTNTFHLLIGEKQYGKIKVLCRESRFVRIGKGGISNGYITEDAKKRAIDTLKFFKEKMDAFELDRVEGTATSAIRSAENGQELLEEIRKITGVHLRAISGAEEAEIIYHGVKSAMVIGETTSIIMDIGGGSVEFIICNQNEILWKQSFEVGAQRLYDRFHKSEPIEKEAISKLEDYLEEQLTPLVKAIEEWNPAILIGSAGTFNTLAAMHQERFGLQTTSREEEYFLPLKDLPPLLDALLTLTKEERLQIPGMIPQRVDMMPVACSLFNFILKKLPNVDHLRVSRAALKEGLLSQILTVE